MLTSKINSVAGAAVSRYDYTVNSLGQRTQIGQNGSAFTSGSAVNQIGYDSLGQVISANRFAGGSPVAGWQSAFNYDSIGNRNWASLDTTGTTSYVKNSLNQYKAVSGTELNYDDDGNLLSDGQNTYTWDGENRLISVTTGSTTTTNIYDPLSRRIGKSVSTGSNTGFVYDGWNLVGEYNLSGTSASVSALNTWGLDLSNSTHGAGGVGGLLARNVGGTNYSVTFDGNGNVSELVNDSEKVIQHFEYGAFGEVKTVYDPNQVNNPFRFSTKYADDETGLVYYGYRFYQAGTGRWINRDPIEEDGGINLYDYVSNNPIMYIDALGMSKESVLEKLTKAEKLMQQKCFCCDHDGESKCKSEATKIVNALKKVINDNYGRGDGGPDRPNDHSFDPVGGYLCWDWANAFNNTINRLHLTEWQSSVQAFAPDNPRRTSVHFAARLHIGKETSPGMCIVFIDDSWPGGNGDVLHQPPWPRDELRMHPVNSITDPATGGLFTPRRTNPRIW